MNNAGCLSCYGKWHYFSSGPRTHYLPIKWHHSRTNLELLPSSMWTLDTHLNCIDIFIMLLAIITPFWMVIIQATRLFSHEDFPWHVVYSTKRPYNNFWMNHTRYMVYTWYVWYQVLSTWISFFFFNSSVFPRRWSLSVVHVLLLVSL